VRGDTGTLTLSKSSADLDHALVEILRRSPIEPDDVIDCAV
jgi:hypothetical protein